MIQIIKENRPSDTGSEFVEAFSNLGTSLHKKLGERLENTALKDKYGIDLDQIRDPDTRQKIIASELEQRRKQKKSDALAGVNYKLTGKGSNSNPPSKNNQSSYPQKTSPSQKTSYNKNIENIKNDVRETESREPVPINIQSNSNGMQAYSNNMQPNSNGNLYNEQTEEDLQPVYNQDELQDQAQRMSDESGGEIDPLSAYDIAKGKNDDAISHNRLVNEDKVNRSNSQTRYQGIGEAALNKYFGEEVIQDGKKFIVSTATPKMLSILENNAIQYARDNNNEAEIKRKLFKDAEYIKDKISNVENSPKPKRAWTKFSQNSLDTGRTKEKEELAIKNELKPLLEMGLHDEARIALAKTGRFPEEIENLVSSQGENTKKGLSDFIPIKKVEAPKKPQFAPIDPYEAFTNTFQPWKAFRKKEEYRQEDERAFEENLSSVLQSDPTSNLFLLRKSYEDKGVDWKLFKDKLDYLVSKGIIKLNPEQSNQSVRLNEPPLDGLQKLLFDFDLTGR